jgi:hypothetical protein
MKITKDYPGLVDIGWAYEFNGDIITEESLEIDLGEKWLKVTGSIVSKMSIKAGGGIKAGWGIKAGGGIEAGWGIKAGGGIEAGEGIEAGLGIEAGGGIRAGGGIKAGEGIEAGLNIICKSSLSCGLRIFAGTCNWRIPTDEEKTITCGKLEKGEVAYGILKEVGK